MTTVTAFTAEKSQENYDNSIVSGAVVGGELILTKGDGSTVNLGAVGAIKKVTAFPGGATDGDVVARTDQPGDPLYKLSDGAWELQPRMGALTVPYAQISRATDQNVVANAQILMGVVDGDTNGMTTTANALTIKTPGLYLLSVHCYLSGGLNGGINLKVNGTGVGAEFVGNGDSSGELEVNVVLRLSAGDVVAAYNASGSSTLTVLGSPGRSPHMSATWLGGAGQTVDERGVPSAILAGLPGGTAVNVPTATLTAVPFAGATLDSDGMFASANNTRLTCKTPGVYRVSTLIWWDTDTTFNRQTLVRKNGTITVPGGSWTDSPSGGGALFGHSTEVVLAAGDYIELLVYQGTGSTRQIKQDIGSGVIYVPYFSAILVATGKTVTPYSRVFHSTTQSIPNNTQTVLAFDSERTDNDGIHDTVTNNSRMVCRTAGVYSIMAMIEFATSGGGRRAVQFRVNGTDFIANDAKPGNNPANFTSNTTVELAVGDYVEVVVYQDSGVSVNVSAGSKYQCDLTMVKIGAPNSGVVGNLPQTFPSNIERSAANHAQVETNWPVSSVAANDTQIFGFYRTSSGVQNAELAWDELLDSGTYTFRLLHAKGNDHGIYTVSIDGTVVGTIEGYDPAISLLNQFGEILNIPISAGKRRISIKMATKNGSSANYYGQITQWSLTKN